MGRCLTSALACSLACSFAASCLAAPTLVAATSPTSLSGPVLPVVLFGRDGRRTPEAFARRAGVEAKALKAAHAASGLVTCGEAHGAGQITLASDVVTTAAHVLFDEHGARRAASCTFDDVVDGRAVSVPIDVSSVVAGSVDPYSVDVSLDWAVARLTRDVEGVVPYGLAQDLHADLPTTFVSRGHVDWGHARDMSMEDCELRDQIPGDRSEGTREFSFDCDTGDGASGGALLFGQERTRIGAILVGWRSNRPTAAVPFSPAHYNFAVTVEGDFRRAVLAVASVRPRVSQR